MSDKAQRDILCEQITAAWHLTDLKCLKDAAHATLWRCVQDRQACVLKIGHPTGIAREIAALQAYAGHGGVPLRQINAASGLFLMKDLQPGASLATFFPDADQDAVRIAVQLLQRLHQASIPEGIFPHIAECFAPFQEVAPPNGISEALWCSARTLAMDLLAYTGPEVLLHGDLHHDNILLNDAEWYAIDPHGLQGEAGWDVAGFMRNPVPHILHIPELSPLLRQRLTTFGAVLQVPPQRLAEMSFVGAVLAAVWAVQDDTPPTSWCFMAEAIQALL